MMELCWYDERSFAVRAEDLCAPCNSYGKGECMKMSCDCQRKRVCTEKENHGRKEKWSEICEREDAS